MLRRCRGLLRLKFCIVCLGTWQLFNLFSIVFFFSATFYTFGNFSRQHLPIPTKLEQSLVSWSLQFLKISEDSPNVSRRRYKRFRTFPKLKFYRGRFPAENLKGRSFANEAFATHFRPVPLFVKASSRYRS